MVVGEALWLPDGVPVGVGVIKLVSDGVNNAEVDVDIDTLLVSKSEMLLDSDGDTDVDVELLSEGLDDTEWDGDNELLLVVVGEALWLPDDVAVGVGGEVIVDVLVMFDIDADAATTRNVISKILQILVISEN